MKNIHVKILSITIFLVTILSSFGAVSLESDNVSTDKPDDIVPGELVVGFTDGIDMSKLKMGSNDPVLGCKIVHIIKSINAATVEVPEGKEDLFISRYQASPFVRYAEPNGIMKTSAAYPYGTNDLGWYKQWGPESIGCTKEGGWDETGGQTAVIAIVDSGVDLEHPDLIDRLWTNTEEEQGDEGVDDDGNGYIDDIRGWNFCFNVSNTQDDNGHGTHCAGIAAASTNNLKGIAGVAGKAPVQIMAVKVLYGGGSGRFDDIAAGIIYAAENGADVISMSLGGSWSSDVVYDACEAANASDVVIVAAAGNDGSTYKHFPAAYPSVISVAAIDSNDERASFSNYGKDWVDIAAPGVDIYSTFWRDVLILPHRYQSLSGTSMACPHVAGVAALAKTNDNTRDEIWALLENFADPLDGDFVAWGKVDVACIGEEAENKKVVVPKNIKVELTINHIEQLDDIDLGTDLGGDGIPGELFFSTTTISNGTSQERKEFHYADQEITATGDVFISYYNNTWIHSDTWDMNGGINYVFDVYGKSTMDINIKLMDDDETSENIWDFDNDVSDISSRPPGDSNDDGKTFRTTYDLRNDTLDESKDKTVPIDSDYYFPRHANGEWDGSYGEEPLWGWADDDAYLNFTISDNYEYGNYNATIDVENKLDFGTQRPTALVKQTLTIKNGAEDDPLNQKHDDLEWTATREEGDWFTINGTNTISGTAKIDGPHGRIRVDIDCNDLSLGTTNGKIKITDNWGNAEYVTVKIFIEKAKNKDMGMFEVLQARFPALFRLFINRPVFKILTTLS